ncbi:MAG: C40 family peptidase [Spirochaetota bacterium]
MWKAIRKTLLCLPIILFVLEGCTPPPGTEYVGMQTIRRSGQMYRASTTSEDPLFSDGGLFSGVGGGSRSTIVRRAKSCIGTPYRYGGTDKNGFDCSGLVIYSYRDTKVSLPRSSSAQFSKGKRISFDRARPGDLVFFKTFGNRISHVGIYLGNYQFVHAPSTGKKVQIDSVKNSYWKRTYAGTVTYL